LPYDTVTHSNNNINNNNNNNNKNNTIVVFCCVHVRIKEMKKKKKKKKKKQKKSRRDDDNNRRSWKRDVVRPRSHSNVYNNVHNKNVPNNIQTQYNALGTVFSTPVEDAILVEVIRTLCFSALFTHCSRSTETRWPSRCEQSGHFHRAPDFGKKK
jgi:hypothetical protein